MINSNVFDYINVMGKTADASWKRNEILANNLANVNTPRYKRQDINFEAQLRQALGNSRYESVDDKVASLHVGDLQARVYTDAANFSYRLDGNNVDVDTENVELASNQIKYNGLISSIFGTASDRYKNQGVKVSSVKEDTWTQMNMVYDPSHPDADENGYVTYPNVNVVTEMTNLIDASRSYEANATAFNASKSMAMKGLEIAQS